MTSSRDMPGKSEQVLSGGPADLSGMKVGCHTVSAEAVTTERSVIRGDRRPELMDEFLSPELIAGI